MPAAYEHRINNALLKTFQRNALLLWAAFLFDFNFLRPCFSFSSFLPCRRIFLHASEIFKLFPARAWIYCFFTEWFLANGVGEFSNKKNSVPPGV